MWIIPSRGRPGQMLRLLPYIEHLPVYIRLDFDDNTISQYNEIAWPNHWIVHTGSRVPLSEVYNEFFRLYPDLPYYAWLADDVLPETPNWDRILIAAAGNDGLAYGDDGINGEAHAPHFVLGGDLVREIGWLALPGLDRIYIDTVWCDIARERGVMRYLPDVKMTHLHFSNRRALMDATYRKHRKSQDRQIYENWRNGPRIAAGGSEAVDQPGTS